MDVTTTSDPHGGGHPRLIFIQGEHASAAGGRREFALLPGVTRIGSAADADLQLPGLDDHHAEIRRDVADEYNFVHLGSPEGSTVDGRFVGETVLRTGSRITMREWTLSFFREEFADHGRPYGGRQGGERFTFGRTQREPRPRDTSTAGGSERDGADPGEYYR